MRMLLGALALPLVLAACPSSRVNIEEATKVLRSSDGCPRLNVGGHKAPLLQGELPLIHHSFIYLLRSQSLDVYFV